MAKIVVGPTRRDVERLLFKELNFSAWGGYSQSIKQIEVDIKNRQEHIEKDAVLVKLRKKLDAEKSKYHAARKTFGEKKQKVQRLYRAKGMVPSVLKAVEKLVAEVNNCPHFGEHTSWE